MLISPLYFTVLCRDCKEPREQIVVRVAIGVSADLPSTIMYDGAFYSFECNKGCSDSLGNYFDYKLTKTPDEKQCKEALEWAEHCKREENMVYERQVVQLHKKIDDLTRDRLAVKCKQKEIAVKWDENIELIKTKMGQSSIPAKKGENHPFGGCRTSY